MLDAMELLNALRPEHTRTSCSDDNLSNGWDLSGFEFGHQLIRCGRCALLELVNEEISIQEIKDLGFDISKIFF